MCVFLFPLLYYLDNCTVFSFKTRALHQHTQAQALQMLFPNLSSCLHRCKRRGKGNNSYLSYLGVHKQWCEQRQRQNTPLYRRGRRSPAGRCQSHGSTSPQNQTGVFAIGSRTLLQHPTARYPFCQLGASFCA